MRLRQPYRSLLLQAALWIAAPIGLVLLAAIVAGTLAYQQVLSALLLDRDRELATLSAARIAETLDSYVLLLDTLAQTTELREILADPASSSWNVPEEILEVFSAGVVLTDRGGSQVAASPPELIGIPSNVSNEIYFVAIRQSRRPAFSDIVLSAATGKEMIVLGVPVLDAAGRMQGVLLAGIDVDAAPLDRSIRRLNTSDEEFAYLVDGNGRAIFHPDPLIVGVDLSDRPFVRRVIAGESGGMLWTAPGGERLVQGYAPVSGTGWGLVVREPWETVVAPVRTYGLAFSFAAVAVLGMAGLLLGLGVRRITHPIAQLSEQARDLWQRETISPLQPTGIQEIDALAQAFAQMADRVAEYRAGLRHYVGAITRSQEDERLRLARDLHDETTQSLLAMQRQLELYQALTSRSERHAALARLQRMLEEATQALRAISRDLRPFLLEDLGLISALRSLLDTADAPEAELPSVEFVVSGQPVTLTGQQELAVYRIVQEVWANIRKHAAAKHVRVELRFTTRTVELIISDDGGGFELPASLVTLPQQGRYGLMGIQERVWGVGGQLSIETYPGSGTRVGVTIPML